MGNSTQVFEDWKVEHEKTYTGKEHSKRLTTFLSNKELVETHNAENHGWTMALNQFADMSTEEFNSLYLGFEPTFTDKLSTNVHETYFQERRRTCVC
jgi:hypothetical protein